MRGDDLADSDQGIGVFGIFRSQAVADLHIRLRQLHRDPRELDGKIIAFLGRGSLECREPACHDLVLSFQVGFRLG